MSAMLATNASGHNRATEPFTRLLDAVRCELNSTTPDLDTVVRLRMVDLNRCELTGYALHAGFPTVSHSEAFDSEEIALVGPELLAYAWVDAFGIRPKLPHD
ncbi:MAG: hypothetical protein ACT4P7_23845 [Gemmatimonadaceae bacterium]